ncbi:hypothetical protein HYW94_03035 [Candidatus Uhrbacteria bacterium]|nr:hypothetical protein [Candidatus Uhrbacteria bacterium]
MNSDTQKATWFGDLLVSLAKNLFRRVILDRFQFCWVRNNLTGKIMLREGPSRFWLGSFGEIKGGVQKKIILRDGEWVRVHNPYIKEQGDIAEGERAIRVGPDCFSLHFGEQLDSQGVKSEIILTDDDALLVRAIKEAPHPVESHRLISAGKEVIVRGFCRFVPHKDIEIVEHRVSASLSLEEGKYVQNDDTGEVRLEQGEQDLFLEQNESFWEKKLTPEEEEALGFIPQQVGRDTRVLVASPRPRRDNTDAVVVDLEDHQAICLHHGKERQVVLGPATVFFGPHERPRVLHLSGGVPVKPNALRVAVLDLGPDFILDKLVVRTKDNATLVLDVNFHWRFQVDLNAPEKVFSLKDPIGFAVEVLSSEIREIAAKHDFEAFHAGAARLIKEVIFDESGSRVFPENGFEVFGIDVEGITPEDEEIQEKLADAIKANVDVFTNRLREEAKLDSERRLIEGRKKNEEVRKALLELETVNERFRILESAKTARAAKIETATGEAEALIVKAQAERDAEKERLAVVISALEQTGGARFIELERARALQKTDKVIVPTDARMHLGVDRLMNEE